MSVPAPDAELERLKRLLDRLESEAGDYYEAPSGSDDEQEALDRMLHARDVVIREVQRREAAAREALENVKLLAVRRRRTGFQPGDADHLLRFCAEAGVVPNPLRAAHPEG